MRSCRTCGRESDERYCSPQCRLFDRKQLDTRWELVIKSTRPLDEFSRRREKLDVSHA